jgi:predicted O-methyltransferase YrrM
VEAALQEHPSVSSAAVVIFEDRLSVMLSALGDTEAGSLLSEIEALSDDEADLLLDIEQTTGLEKNMIRKSPDFDVFLRLRRGEFIQPPRDSQRNWLLQRTLDELTDDLNHLNVLAKSFVAGSDRPPIEQEWKSSRAEVNGSSLIIQGQQVMQEWERPLMHAMAGIVTETHGDVLEIGFGMGISATAIQDRQVRSHTIVECNEEVIKGLDVWRKRYPRRDIRLVEGKWQDVVPALGFFDAILFDTYPIDEEEYREAVLNSITFAEPFVEAAAGILRDGGVFTYYTNEIDSLSRRHQRLLFRYFQSVTLSVVRQLAPPADCNYWWADSMAVVKAVK